MVVVVVAACVSEVPAINKKCAVRNNFFMGSIVWLSFLMYSLRYEICDLWCACSASHIPPFYFLLSTDFTHLNPM